MPKVPLLLLILVALGCSPREREPLTPAERTEKILDGKRALSSFDGATARTEFAAVDADYRTQTGSPHCEAAYGASLANLQIALDELNPILLQFVGEQFGLLDADVSNISNLLNDGWPAIEAALVEAGEYAAAVTGISGCEFSIGLEEPVDDSFDNMSAQYQFPLHLLDSENPVLEIVFSARFDGVEARLIQAVIGAGLALADGVLAHDLTLELDDAKLAHQLGSTEACVRDGFLACLLAGPLPVHAPIHLLDWAFVFADNPKFLTKAPERWDERFAAVDNHLISAIAPLRSLFSEMLVRTRRHSEQSRDDALEEFALVYVDANHNSKIDTADSIGVNIDEIRFTCEALIGVLITEAEEQECRIRVSSYDDLALILMNFIRSAASPSGSVIEELDSFFTRAYLSFRAVDDPDVAYEPIPFDSLSRLFSEVLPILNAPFPNFLAFDFAAFFRNPRPVRDYVPTWFKHGGIAGARFKADGDEYPAFVSPPATLTSVDVYLDEAHGGLIWGLLGRTVFSPVDLEGAIERELFPCPGCVPADCLNATNLFSVFEGIPVLNDDEEIWRWPVFYLDFPDPALNGLVLADPGVWNARLDPEAGNGGFEYGDASCDYPSGFQPADAKRLHQSLWLGADFFFDHFQLYGLLRRFSDGGSLF